MTGLPTASTSSNTTSLDGDAAGEVSREFLSSLADAFDANPALHRAQNAVTRHSVHEVALNRSVVTESDESMSQLLDDWKVTNQKKSGRCWMFAALNLMRVGAMEAMNLKDFEFSQNYPLFWDKFERANYFLEAIIETADRPLEDRTVAFLLDRPADDGGQWNMFMSIIRKYGIVPQAAMPETESSSNTRIMNSILTHKLREGAQELRDLRSGDAPVEAARAAKENILAAVHRILCVHLGTPPETFDWQWNDKDRAFHRDGTMTPRQFAEKYITLPLDEYICLVNDPRESSPYGRTFTVEYLGNVIGGPPVTYLNVEMPVLKDIAMRILLEGEPVWFGCDVGKMMDRKLGLWDPNLYEYAGIYDTEFTLDKAGRLLYHQTFMTHAMLFTGVDVEGDSPRRWRVENSWGEDNGNKGFYTMNDGWFDEHMFEIAARRSMLPPDAQEALEQDPIVLPPWDPMGSLAG